MLNFQRAINAYNAAHKQNGAIVEMSFDELVSALEGDGHSKEDAEFHAKTCEILRSCIFVGDKMVRLKDEDRKVGRKSLKTLQTSKDCLQ